MERPIPRTLSAVAIAIALAVSVPSTSHAQSAQGLGTSQPNAPDLSISPQFHVYRWDLAGIAYVQVNDSAGNVLGAFAAGGGQVLILPVGKPSNFVSMSPAANSAAAGIPVYQTSTINVTVSNGQFAVSNSPAAVVQTQAVCQDPGECSQVIAKPPGN